MLNDYLNTRDELQKFAKYVIQQSRSNLTKGKKNVNKKLYESLGYDLNVSKNSFSLKFLMEEYGSYQDLGVSGVEEKHDTPYQFTKKALHSKKFVDNLLEWVKAKGYTLRDEKGRFRKGGQKGLAYAMRRNKYKYGIKPSLFFTKPFEKAYDRLPIEIIEAYGLDIEKLIKITK